MQRIARIAEPSVEPVTLDEVKHHCGIALGMVEDDAYLMRLVAAGRRIAENRLGIATTPSKWRSQLYTPAGMRCSCHRAGSMPANVVALPRGPVLQGGPWGDLEVFVSDHDGQDVPVPFTSYSVNTRLNAVTFRNGAPYASWAEYWAGHENPATIPATIKHAICMVAVILYSNRGDGTNEGEVSTAWDSVQTLLLNEWDGGIYV